MSVYDLLQKEAERHEKALSRLVILKELPDKIINEVSFFDATSCFMEDSESFDDVLALIHGTKYTLNDYYINCGRLALRYNINGLSIHFFIPATDEDLAKVSGGKCQLETESVEKVTSKIVCNL